MNVFELNCDGLVGPTHHYAGLALGNFASTENALKTANPQAAALQGLQKMRFLHSLGLKQAIIPPHERPNLHLLYDLGFRGTPAQIMLQAQKSAPELLSACFSASAMWTANMATVAPSLDTEDGMVHFTAANLISNLHRHQEAYFSKKILETIFAHEDYFLHHPILPATTVMGDEGAANHNRLCQSHAQKGLHLFVYGKKATGILEGPTIYPARQTIEASQAIARKHLLHPKQVVFARQNPKAIDSGVFHNDVISVANESVFLVHQEAFVQQKEVLETLQQHYPFTIIEIPSSEVSIADAINTYLFNSQLISLPNSKDMMLLAPEECQSNHRVRACIDKIISDATNPIQHVHYFDLKQSMRNGGGPACLRLRVPLNEIELSNMHRGVLATNTLLDDLEKWVLKHYRTELSASDLVDTSLIDEGMRALDELTQILQLGTIYSFQI
jgi:succinylarginine dihydrolase